MPWLYVGRTGPIADSTLDTDGALSVSSLRESLWFGDVLRGIMERNANAIFAIFDPNTGRVYSTDDADHKTALLAEVGSPDYSIILKPDGGQSGRALAWSVETNNGWPEKANKVDPLIDAVKPRRTVESLSNKLLTNHLSLPVFLLLNQATGRLELRYFLSGIEDISAGLAAVEPAGNAIAIQFTQPPGRFSDPEWPVL